MTDFNGTPFDQRFVINNFMNNLTKVSGEHTLQGRRSTTSAPTTGGRPSGPCSRTSSSEQRRHPQNTGHPFANALLGLFDTYTQAEQKITSN